MCPYFRFLLLILSYQLVFPCKNTSLAAKGALANRLQRRIACKIQNGRSSLQVPRINLDQKTDPL